MKRLLCILLTALSCCASAKAQGYLGDITFTTYNANVNAYASNAVTGMLLTGAVYSAQLFFGPVGTPEESLLAVTNPPATLNARGYVTTGTGGGTRHIYSDDIAWTAEVWFQVRVWTASMGSDYWTAYATWISGSNPTGIVAYSNIIPVVPLLPLKPPNILHGLEPIIYRGVPEPSIALLVLVALPALVWHRRWSRSPRRQRELEKG